MSALSLAAFYTDDAKESADAIVEKRSQEEKDAVMDEVLQDIYIPVINTTRPLNDFPDISLLCSKYKITHYNWITM